jgi:hypothetical protein
MNEYKRRILKQNISYQEVGGAVRSKGQGILSRVYLLLALEDGADRITDIPGGVEAIAGLQRKTRRQNPTPGVKK